MSAKKKTPKKFKPAKYNPQPQSNKLTYILGGLAVLVIAAVVIIFVVVPGINKTSVQNEGYGPVRNAPVQVMNQQVVRLGNPDAKTTVDAYEDFMCPVCAQFEHLYGQQIAQAVDQGKIAVRYHMLDFLNPNSASGDYSDRAAAAALCVADTGDATAFSKFHTALFSPDVQPQEHGSTDNSNQQLADIAKKAGANPQAVQCISSGQKVDAAKQGAQNALNELKQKSTDGSVGTPTVYHGDQKINIGDPNWLTSLIQQ